MKNQPRIHLPVHELPCTCWVTVTEEPGGHWWRFEPVDTEYLCRKAKRMDQPGRVAHWRDGYAREKWGAAP